MFRNLSISHLLKKNDKKNSPANFNFSFAHFSSPFNIREKYSFSYNVIWYEQRLFYFSIFLFSLVFSFKMWAIVHVSVCVCVCVHVSVHLCV